MLALALSTLLVLHGGHQPGDVVHEIVTDDGLRIWSFPDDGGDRFLLMVLVGSGARHESADQAGAAHLLEHVLLASTETRGKEEANRALNERGGTFNGYTKHDVTTYYLTCSSNSWEFAVEWLADHIVHPGFDPADIAAEQGIVYEELDSRQPHAGVIGLEEYLYPDHALSRSIGGDKARISKLPIDVLGEFYREHYRAPNMAVGFAGKVPERECVDAIRAAFGGLPASGSVAQSERVTPKTGRTILGDGAATTDSGWVTAGYHLPAGGAIDTAIQLHLRAYLADRLFDEVRENRQLSYGPAAGIVFHADTVRLEFDIEVSDRSNLPTVMRVIEELIDELQMPDAETLDSASRAVAGTLRANTASQLAAAMELSWLMRRASQSPAALEIELASVRGVDVADYAAEHLTKEYSFAIASASLGGGKPSILATVLGVLAVLLLVDFIRGFVWVHAVRSLLARMIPRRSARTAPHRRPSLPPIEPGAVEELERSIQEFYAETDRDRE